MKRFIKKHRFKIIVSILLIIFIYVCFYMLWVHVPYLKQEKELNYIQQNICQKYDYTFDDYVNEYQNDNLNYIVRVKEDNKKLYVVCNEKYKKLDEYQGKVVKKDVVREAFYNKYQVNCSKIEVGYENDRFVYCLMYKGKDTLIYAYYNIEDGEFLKAYKL